MKLPLALKLGSAILGVLTAMFLAAGLLASTLASSEIRSLLRTEILPGVGSTLAEYAELFTSLLEDEQRQARAQAEEWFNLNGENLAQSLLGEVFPLAEGYDFGAIETLLETRVASNALLAGATAHMGFSGEDQVEVGNQAQAGTRVFVAESEGEFTKVRVEISVLTAPLTAAFEQTDAVVATAMQEVIRQREVSERRLATSSQDASRRASRRLAGYLAAAGVVALGLTAGFLWLILTRLVTRPIGAFAAAAQATAEGNLGLTVELHREDEIGDLADVFREMTSSLRAIVTGLRGTTERLSAAARTAASASQRTHQVVDVQSEAMETVRNTTIRMDETLAAVVESTNGLTMGAAQAAAAVEEMTVSISQVAERTEGHAKTADDAASRVEQMIHSLSEIAAHLQGLTATSEEISATLYQVRGTVERIEGEAHTSAQATVAASKEASERGIPAIREAVAGMEQIKDSMGQLDAMSRRLTVRSRDIGQIVTVIDGVAGQTKLLALNAAILAAQAGRHGTGFSVVANQIRGLAERTAQSTKEIAEVIASMQEETRNTAETTAQGLDAVDNGRARIAEVEAVFTSISKRTETAATLSESIREATAEEAVAVTQITESLRSMSDEVDSIARATFEQDRSNRAVLDLMKNIRTSADDVMESTTGQLAASREISEVTTKVAANVQQIAAQVQDQKEQSTAIVNSVDAVTATIAELVDSASGMEGTVRDLETQVEGVRAGIGRFHLGDDSA